MSDKFAELEEPKSRSRLFAVVAVLLLVVYAVYRLSTMDFQPLHGRVESVQAPGVSKVAGSAVETASVRLADGSLVEAEVVSGGPLSRGDDVRLVVRPASAAGTPYEVVAKLPGSEP